MIHYHKPRPSKMIIGPDMIVTSVDCTATMSKAPLSQSVRDALADAETLRLNGPQSKVSNLQKASRYTWAGLTYWISRAASDRMSTWQQHSLSRPRTRLSAQSPHCVRRIESHEPSL
jgi:hypothetical protein